MANERYLIVITPRAETELEQITSRIAAESPHNARRFVTRLHAAIKRLDRLPSRGAPAPEGYVGGHVTRQLVHEGYRIPYAVAERHVVVIGIRHQSRLPLSQ